MKSLLSIFEEESGEDNNNDIIDTLYDYTDGTLLYNDLLDSDPFIYDVQSWTSDKFNRIIVFNVKTEEFFEELDLSESDIHMYNAVIGSGYYDFQFEDFYQLEQDFLDGYSFFENYFNNENMELLKKISTYLLPDKEFQIGSESFKKELNNIIYSSFETKIVSILQEFHYLRENAYFDSMKKTIHEDFIEILDKMGFEFKEDRVASRIYNLILKAREFNYEGDLKGLYTKILNKYKGQVEPGWGEYYDIYDDDFFDSESFNKDVNDNLSQIIELIENGEIDYSKFVSFVRKVTKISKIDEWQRIPKKPTYRYKVISFDKTNMKVLIYVQTPKGIVKRNLTEEGFFNFLYHPELFDLEA